MILPADPSPPTPWDMFWSWVETPLGSNIIAGLIVLAIAGIASAIYKRIKGRSAWGRLWEAVRVAFDWIFSIRLTTVNRRGIDTTEAYGRGREAMKAELMPQVQDVARELEEVTSLVDKLKAADARQRTASEADQNTIRELRTRVAKFEKDEKQRQGKEFIEKVINSPKPPLPRPRWLIIPNPRRLHNWLIKNNVPRSTARETRVDGQGQANITDAGHWPDLSVSADGKGGIGYFTGIPNSEHQPWGIDFVIGWYDEHGKYQSETYNAKWPADIWANADPF